MPTSSGGYPFPVTSLARRLPVDGHAPECVADSDSQRPTIHRLHQRRPHRADRWIGLQAPPVRRAALAGTHELNRYRRAWLEPLDPVEAGATVDPRRDSAMAVSSHRVPVRRQCGLRQQIEGTSADRQLLTRALAINIGLVRSLQQPSLPAPHLHYHLSSPAKDGVGYAVEIWRRRAAASATTHQTLMGPRRGGGGKFGTGH